MFEKEKLEEYLNKCLSTGADFAEIFVQNSNHKSYKLINSRIDDVSSSIFSGVGIRIILGDKIVYGSLNDISYENIMKKIDELISNFDLCSNKKVNLVYSYIDPVNKIEIWPDSYSDTKKVQLLHDIDNKARKYPKVSQVMSLLSEIRDDVIIANSLGKYVIDKRLRIRLFSSIYVSSNGVIKSMSGTYGKAMGYEMFSSFDIDNYVKSIYELAYKKLDAKACPGGVMPVILGDGFCGTIMHEAVGHTLEASSVSVGNSIMCGKLLKNIASSKLTLVDDGTIPNEWGSNNVDDEGNMTSRNVLIDHGVVTNYLVDMFHSKIMNLPSNGCSRRQDYSYAPTSRMSNTFIVSGDDSIDDMIKSIKYGIFVRNMNGGTVKPETGDFNFNCSSACMIIDGKLSYEVDDVMLIGNALSIIKNITMVSKECRLQDGLCGASSGFIPVTVGQPYILVSSVLVGGSDV